MGSPWTSSRGGTVGTVGATSSCVSAVGAMLLASFAIVSASLALREMTAERVDGIGGADDGRLCEREGACLDAVARGGRNGALIVVVVRVAAEELVAAIDAGYRVGGKRRDRLAARFDIGLQVGSFQKVGSPGALPREPRFVSTNDPYGYADGGIKSSAPCTGEESQAPVKLAL